MSQDSERQRQQSFSMQEAMAQVANDAAGATLRGVIADAYRQMVRAEMERDQLRAAYNAAQIRIGELEQTLAQRREPVPAEDGPGDVPAANGAAAEEKAKPNRSH